MKPPAGLQRRFLALVIGPVQAAALTRAFERTLELEAGSAGPSWLRRVAPEDLHLTLFFLGTPAESAWRAAWEGALGAATGRAAPELVLDRFGCFPRRGSERVLWAGVSGPGFGQLCELQSAVQAAVARAGFEPEPRPWAPHVTLARVRGRDAALAAAPVPAAFHAEALAIAWTPLELALVRSRSADERGPGVLTRAYEVQERFSFAAV